jgi:two-component system, sensor histidine kinase and response regulator
MDQMDGLELSLRIHYRPELERPLVLLLSSVGRHFEASVVREAGISRWLTKPVSPSELLDALTDAWEGQRRPDARSAEPSASPAAPGQLRVLLAEDSVVNQKVAMRMLDRLGCQVEVAANGAQAVEMAARTPYDLIFMDCQMPEMDGYEATRRIRENEGEARHAPIVALTAHAMAGDRERCLAAGMDDYLSKPVPREDMETMLRRYAGAASGLPGDVPAPRRDGRFDTDMLLRAVDRDRAILEELARLFRGQSLGQLAELRAALEASDARVVHRTGHALKGSLASLYAKEAAALAHEVEEAGRSGNMELARRVLPKLEEQVRAIPDELLELARTLTGTEDA